jgi:hypothetical protein
MKIKILIASMAIALVGCGEESAEIAPEKPEAVISDVVIVEKISEKIEEVKIKEVKIEEVKVVADDSINYKDYSSFSVKAKNKELQKMIDESLVSYETLIDSIDSQIEDAKKETNSNYAENIEELKATLKEENVSYDKDCKEIKASNNDLCNHKGKTKTTLENKIKGLESNLINEIKSLDNQKENTFKNYQAKLKTNVSKLLSQDD